MNLNNGQTVSGTADRNLAIATADGKTVTQPKESVTRYSAKRNKLPTKSLHQACWKDGRGGVNVGFDLPEATARPRAWRWPLPQTARVGTIS